MFGRHTIPARAARGSARGVRLVVDQDRTRQGGDGRDLRTTEREEVTQADRRDVADRVEDHDAFAERLGVVERLEERGLVVDHPARLRTGDRQWMPLARSSGRRPTTGRDDHCVGLEREHRFRRGVDAEADVHTAAGTFSGAPVREVGQLLASR